MFLRFLSTVRVESSRTFDFLPVNNLLQTNEIAREGYYVSHTYRHIVEDCRFFCLGHLPKACLQNRSGYLNIANRGRTLAVSSAHWESLALLVRLFFTSTA
ncbi:hypothetical protein ANANG_G00013380 [Anguilla anguilla]|uniref:Uncharacterized protein n=1 Tax=Anguilla anguilla TaxID=7936 RepID=A0A9D3MX96_ANGAN|nr:hypothetical protein ANANG_G00013380 [Anguilla anguilla]